MSCSIALYREGGHCTYQTLSARSSHASPQIQKSTDLTSPRKTIQSQSPTQQCTTTPTKPPLTTLYKRCHLNILPKYSHKMRLAHLHLPNTTSSPQSPRSNKPSQPTSSRTKSSPHQLPYPPRTPMAHHTRHTKHPHHPQTQQSSPSPQTPSTPPAAATSPHPTRARQTH